MERKNAALVVGLGLGVGALIYGLANVKAKPPDGEPPEEPPPGFATLYGVVTSDFNNKPISGVMVSYGDEVSTLTDTNGYYELTNLSPGEYVIIFTCDSYQERQIPITVVAGKNELNISLVPIGEIIYEIHCFDEPQPLGATKGLLVEITNTYTHAVTETVTMTGDFGYQERTVTIGPGKEVGTGFTFHFDTPGTFTVFISGTSFAGASCTFTVAEELGGEVIGMSVAPQVQEPGKTVTVTVRVQNRNWYQDIDYDVVLTGAVSMSQTVTIRAHEILDANLNVTVNWEGYEKIYCEGYSVTVKGEPIYHGTPPPGSYICPVCSERFDSSPELGIHLGMIHLGIPYPEGTINEGSYAGMASNLIAYAPGGIEENAEGYALAQWAMGNICSGDILHKNLTLSKKWSLVSELNKIMIANGVDPGDAGQWANSIVFGSKYLIAYWLRWAKPSELKAFAQSL